MPFLLACETPRWEAEPSSLLPSEADFAVNGRSSAAYAALISLYASITFHLHCFFDMGDVASKGLLTLFSIFFSFDVRLGYESRWISVMSSNLSNWWHFPHGQSGLCERRDLVTFFYCSSFTLHEKQFWLYWGLP
jgi:hypothetical protein